MLQINIWTSCGIDWLYAYILMVLGSVLAEILKMLNLHVSEINKNLKGMKLIRRSKAEKIVCVGSIKMFFYFEIVSQEC